jgi:hypothetical protein
VSNIFVSYSRQSQPVAANLVGDIELLGHAVWFDRDLSGGQSWWDQILAHIRACDVFVFVLDQRALNSVACQRELAYAACVRKSVLPVLIDGEVSTSLLPPALSKIQYIDYTKQDRVAALALARALTALPQAQPLPDPLPPPPDAPVSHLIAVAQRVDSATVLALQEQSVLVIDLGRGMRDPDFAADARSLMQKLRKRKDLLATIADEIDELLRAPRPPVKQLASLSMGPDVPAAAKLGPPTRGERLLAAIISSASGGLIAAGAWRALTWNTAFGQTDWQPAVFQLGLVGGIAGSFTGVEKRRIRTALTGCVLGAAIGAVVGMFFSDDMPARVYGVFWNIMGGALTALIIRTRVRAIVAALAGYVIAFLFAAGTAPYEETAFFASAGSVVAAIIGTWFHLL